ncbi:hypothetical protein [Sphingomonas sp. dw_22]|nr:hypothetical protein [Sphingomonas sp. dw_22]
MQGPIPEQARQDCYRYRNGIADYGAHPANAFLSERAPLDARPVEEMIS